MDEPKRQILNYDDLPAEARASIDAYLDAHPEDAALLSEGRTLRMLFEEAGRLNADVPDAETIAQFMAAQHFAQRPLPPDVHELGDRIETAFAEHPDVERQYSMMRDRLKALSAEAESPRAQFERLTGRAPGARSRPAPESLHSNATGTDKSPAVRRHAAETSRAPTTASDRPPLRRVSFSRFGLAAAVLGVLIYGGLLLASQATQTTYARLANLDAVENEFAGLRLRGADGEVDSATDHYAQALETLGEAHTSALGLFPSYTPDGLAETIRLLNEVIAEEDPRSALALEAWMLMGKIFLHEGNVDAAREAFQIVVDREGPAAPNAQRLLTELADAPDL